MTAAVAPSRAPRLMLVCRAYAPLCPRCGNPIHRLRVEHGSVFVACGNRAAREEGRRDARGEIARCNSRLHILGTGHGLCLVVELTEEEHSYLTGRPRDPLELYEYLGIVATTAWIRDRWKHGTGS